MLNYNHLYYFHVVASEGSVAKAADRIGVTQPTISEQLKSLERALGVSLFERQPSGLRLTEAGRTAFEHTSVMFRATDQLTQALGHDVGSVPRVLRVGISGPVGRATTTDLLLPLLTIADCIPSIRTGENTELLRDVRGADLDLAIVESEPSPTARQGLEVVQLASITLVAITAAATETSGRWNNLALVTYRPTSALRWAVDAYLDKHDLAPTLVAEADDALFLLEAGARPGYVSFVPQSVARDALASGRVRELAAFPVEDAGVFGILQDGAGHELARAAVSLLRDRE